MRKSCQRKILQCARTAPDCLIEVKLKASMCPHSIRLSDQGNIEYFRKNLYKGINLSLRVLSQFTASA